MSTVNEPGRAGAPIAHKRRWRATRRGFLIGAGAAGGSLALGFVFGLPLLRRKIAEFAETASAPGSAPTAPDAWFEILPDSRIRLYVTKAEMGQGVHTALAQIVLDELEVDWADLEVTQASSNHVYVDTFGTAGSNSVASAYDPLRQAAATLREMLRGAAAKSLNQPGANLVVSARGFQASGDPGLRVDFARLGEGRPRWEVPKDPVPLKPRAQHTRIGAPEPRVDIPAKVTGAAVYGYDMRLPGMLYGAVARPPTLEANLTSAAAGSSAAVPGLAQIVTAPGFAGAVAGSRAAAHAAVDAMQLTWSAGRKWQQSEIDQIVTVGGAGGVTIQEVGNATRELSARTSLSAEYRTPFAIQTPLEPQAALADVRADSATIWASTQSPDMTRRRVAEALGFKPEQVVVNTAYLGGGFGRKSDSEAAAEAARLSQAAGVPVHVGWTRAEELRHGYLRPPTHHQLNAALESDGTMRAIEHLQSSGEVFGLWLPKLAMDLMGADFGATRGAAIKYAIPNKRTEIWQRRLPVRTGFWRGLGALANCFAVESFIDEAAHLAKIDPLAFRLKHLGGDPWGLRMRAVLEAAARAAGWGDAPPSGRALGIACATDVDTVVAEVAEVSANDAGVIRVHKMTVAVDPGLVINPNGAAAQVEGNVMWGIGSTLLEEARVEDGRISADNFDGYPLLTLPAAPEVRTLLLESDGRPRGMGEPAIAPAPAAIANAVFALTGKRLRQIPFTPERVKL